jgi:hypothetical protein
VSCWNLHGAFLPLGILAAEHGKADRQAECKKEKRSARDGETDFTGSRNEMFSVLRGQTLLSCASLLIYGTGIF